MNGKWLFLPAFKLFTKLADYQHPRAVTTRHGFLPGSLSGANAKPLLLASLLWLTLWLPAQSILVIEKSDHSKNYKYRVNDRIVLQIKKSKTPVHGDISRINDSVIILDYLVPVALKDVEYVFRPYWIKRWLPQFLTTAGLGYIALDVTNNIIVDVGPVLNPHVLLTGGILTAAGLVVAFWPDKRYAIPGKWNYKVIDFNQLKE